MNWTTKVRKSSQGVIEVRMLARIGFGIGRSMGRLFGIMTGPEWLI